MEPQTPIGQLSASMQAGTPALLQQTGGSPNFQPQLQPPPATPMPSKSPATMMHLQRALRRHGIDPMSIPQLAAMGQPMMGQNGQPVQSPVQNPAPGLPPHPVMNQRPPTSLTSPQSPQGEGPTDEASLIVKALEKIAGTFGKRLDKHSEHETVVRDHLFPKEDAEEHKNHESE